MNIKIMGRSGTRLEVTSGYGKIARQLNDLLTHDGEEVNLWVCPPYDRKLPEGFNAILTMHETKELPPSKESWVTNLNQYNLIIVPSHWNKENFVRFGVTTPIEVAPLGVDVTTFHNHKTFDFSILTMHDNFGRTTSRENWRETLTTYIKTFKGIKDCVLYIKTWNYREGALKEELTRISQEEKIHGDLMPHVEIIDKNFTDEELREMMLTMWVFVKNANREGWCLPLNEALACGVTSLYRPVSNLSWAKSMGGIAFNSESHLSGLLIVEHDKYRKLHEEQIKYDIRTTAKIIQSFIQDYYDKSKQSI